jgi:acyl carrier protein
MALKQTHLAAAVLVFSFGCGSSPPAPPPKFVPKPENVSPLTSPPPQQKPVPELPPADPATIEEVRKIAIEQLGVKPAMVKPESRIFDDLGANELDKIELIMKLEEHFSISIPDEQLDIPYPRLTIGRFAAIVDKQRRLAAEGK